MRNNIKIAVAGATGAVGEVMLSMTKRGADCSHYLRKPKIGGHPASIRILLA